MVTFIDVAAYVRDLSTDHTWLALGWDAEAQEIHLAMSLNCGQSWLNWPPPPFGDGYKGLTPSSITIIGSGHYLMTFEEGRLARTKDYGVTWVLLPEVPIFTGGLDALDACGTKFTMGGKNE